MFSKLLLLNSTFNLFFKKNTLIENVLKILIANRLMEENIYL